MRTNFTNNFETKDTNNVEFHEFYRKFSELNTLSEPEGSPSGAEAPLGRSLSRRPNSELYFTYSCYLQPFMLFV
jgi:hypothetical protein